jgi:hypothetical protein
VRCPLAAAVSWHAALAAVADIGELIATLGIIGAPATGWRTAFVGDARKTIAALPAPIADTLRRHAAPLISTDLLERVTGLTELAPAAARRDVATRQTVPAGSIATAITAVRAARPCRALVRATHTERGSDCATGNGQAKVSSRLDGSEGSGDCIKTICVHGRLSVVVAAGDGACDLVMVVSLFSGAEPLVQP